MPTGLEIFEILQNCLTKQKNLRKQLPKNSAYYLLGVKTVGMP